MHVQSYPAGVRVKESPVDAIVKDSRNASASVQEDGKHSLSLSNSRWVFFRLGRLRGIVCHRVLLGNGRDDYGWVQLHERLAQ
jgi:hypothetical protein